MLRPKIFAPCYFNNLNDTIGDLVLYPSGLWIEECVRRSEIEILCLFFSHLPDGSCLAEKQ